jgi:hypothetical protein
MTRLFEFENCFQLARKVAKAGRWCQPGKYVKLLPKAEVSALYVYTIRWDGFDHRDEESASDHAVPPCQGSGPLQTNMAADGVLGMEHDRLMTAAGTQAVEFEPVGLDGKAISGGDLFLQLFDFTVFKFGNLSATRAYQVVVVAFVGHIVVLRLRAEMPGLRDACVAKQVQGPINRGQPKVRIGLGELMVHGLGRDVFLSKEGGEDEFALSGEFELMLAQMFLKDVHFFCVLSGPHRACLHRWPLKTKTLVWVKGRLTGFSWAVYSAAPAQAWILDFT